MLTFQGNFFSCNLFLEIQNVSVWCGDLLVSCRVGFPFIYLVYVHHQELGNTTLMMQQLCLKKGKSAVSWGIKGNESIRFGILYPRAPCSSIS